MKYFLHFIFFIFISSPFFSSQAQQRENKGSISHPDTSSPHLPIVHNHQVKNWISIFQTKYADRFRIWLGRSYRYVPMMKTIFKKQGLPEDLVYLSMIESGFSAQAVSSAKAVGYWQFIQPTALRFGLRKSHWLDERRDFEKSTYAASRYLKLLKRTFGDWYLAIAAYNIGEKRLSYFIQKYNAKNFWSLSQKYDFPGETARYVPQLIAAITIANRPSLYGFDYFKIKFPHQYEIFYLPGGINLRSLANHIKQPYQKIKALNPALISDHIPKYMENWRARLPIGSAKKTSQYISSYLL